MFSCLNSTDNNLSKLFTIKLHYSQHDYFNEIAVFNVPKTLTWMCLERYDREACRNVSSILSVISISGGQLNIQCKYTLLEKKLITVKNSIKIRKQISSPTQLSKTNIRHLFPTLCLIIKLHKHSTIYFSILFVFSFNSIWLYISVHCVVYCCLCVYLVLCCLVLWPQDWINTTTKNTSPRK